MKGPAYQGGQRLGFPAPVLKCSPTRDLFFLGTALKPKCLLEMPLPEFENHRSVFLETTKSEHEHGGPGREFETCLWSG
jgi:hypothetical protein